MTRGALSYSLDTGGLCPIPIGKAFLQFINRFIVLQFWGNFKSTYPPINLEFRPLEAMKPSYLASKPSSNYTLIGLKCKPT